MLPADRNARYRYRLDNQDRSGQRRAGLRWRISEIARWLLAAATAVMPPFCLPIF